jgi:arylsulfatase A-like enzyme
VDALRANHLSCYGYTRKTSPNIDRFAAKSILFEKAISQSPVTLPSHMSIFTSLYPFHHGVIYNEYILNDSIITLPDILHENGYKTVAFTDGGYVKKEYNFHTFDIFDDSQMEPDKKFEKMLAWLEENSKRKFFLFWHTLKVHSPYTPLEKYDVFSDKNYSGIVDVYPNPDEPVCKKRQPGCIYKHELYFQKIMKRLTEADLEYIISKYDGEILHADDQFSELLKLLEKKGILEKTIIILTADHGESFADRENRKKIGHESMYDEVLRIPLIVKIPGYDKHLRVKTTVEAIDIMPTLLEILDTDIPEGLDGQSLFRVIKNPEIEEVAYSDRSWRGLYMVMYNNLKIIYYKKEDTFEFYNLGEDPYERNNIYNENSPVQAEMKQLLLSMMEGKIVSAEKRKLDKKRIEELRALGYIN